MIDRIRNAGASFGSEKERRISLNPLQKVNPFNQATHKADLVKIDHLAVNIFVVSDNQIVTGQQFRLSGKKPAILHQGDNSVVIDEHTTGFYNPYRKV